MLNLNDEFILKDNIINNYNMFGCPILSLEDNRSLEAIYQENEAMNYLLMQEASLAIFRLLVLKIISKEAHILVFVGSGNNGGDGYVIAKLLRKEGFYNVKVVVVVSQKQNITANFARKDYLENGGEELTCFDKELNITNELNSIFATKVDYVVDAMLGIGLKDNFDVTRVSSKAIIKAATLINNLNCTVFAVDVPSLLNSETGKALDDNAIVADYTFSVFGYKKGLLIGEAKLYCGEILIAMPNLENIKKAIQDIATATNILATNYNFLKSLIPKRSKLAHKGDAGRIALIGGNSQMHGALMIASLGALRTGAGLISSYFLDEKGILSLNAQAPEIMSASYNSDLVTQNKLLTMNAIVIGPGFGRDNSSFENFQKIILGLSSTKTSIVIDADGLYHLKNFRDEFLRNNLSNVILTPHVGEAALLLNCSVSDIQKDPINSANKISQLYNATCVLKSAFTIIANQKLNKTFIVSTGSEGMASGGMGDLLSGIIGSFCAQKNDAFLSAILGVCIHGQAGIESAKQDGAIGMAATDLLPYVRKLRNSMF